MSSVKVRNNNGEAAIRALKKTLQIEGVFMTAKRKKYFEKPCDERTRKGKESYKRVKKNKRMMRDE